MKYFKDNTPLENAVKELEEKYFPQTAEKPEPLSINQESIKTVRKFLSMNELEVEIENRAHTAKRKTLDQDAFNLSCLLRFLKGEKGYVRISQHESTRIGIKPDFTSIEEIIGEFKHFECSPWRPTANFGTYIFEVKDNGLLTLIDSKVDSSD